MMLIQFKKIILLALLATTFNAYCEYDFEKACTKIGLSDGEKNLKVVGQKNSSRSYVTVLKDKGTGKKYILKQLKRSAGDPIQVVQEMLGTYVVNWLGLLSQKVIIVPREEFKHLKTLKDQPATLHTFIDEKPLKDIRRFKKLQLRQIKLRSSTKDHGLTRAIIKSMALYSDLAAIVAADTFLGIGDRHRANLLFSNSLQRFWLIDMDYTYHSALVEACIKQIKGLMAKGSKLSAKEYKALLRYKIALEKLFAQFTTPKLLELLDEFLEQAGIEKKQRKSSSGGVSYSSIVSHIEKSNEEMEKLISLIDALISDHIPKKSYK